MHRLSRDAFASSHGGGEGQPAEHVRQCGGHARGHAPPSRGRICLRRCCRQCCCCGGASSLCGTGGVPRGGLARALRWVGRRHGQGPAGERGRVLVRHFRAGPRREPSESEEARRRRRRGGLAAAAAGQSNSEASYDDVFVVCSLVVVVVAWWCVWSFLLEGALQHKTKQNKTKHTHTKRGFYLKSISIALPGAGACADTSAACYL